MSEAQIQAIKDVIKMTPRLSIDSLNSIRALMEKAIDSQLLKLEPTVILENMDITEKVMYLDYLTENDEQKKNELKDVTDFEEILKREGLTIDDLQN
ncbi:MAG: hypothetical protein IJK18_01225 [Clostridia bacterium]|nr:hypothetical protein [Clostridia bacterium]